MGKQNNFELDFEFLLPGEELCLLKKWGSNPIYQIKLLQNFAFEDNDKTILY